LKRPATWPAGGRFARAGRPTSGVHAATGSYGPLGQGATPDRSGPRPICGRSGRKKEKEEKGGLKLPALRLELRISRFSIRNEPAGLG
jgi:hypothetical protein